MKENLILLLLFVSFQAFSQKKTQHFCFFTQYVEPFWGTDSKGRAFAGVCLPFSIVKVGPNCLNVPYQTTGYLSNKPIVGFSHTHLSGTGGGGRYGNILITPQVGDLDLKNRESVQKSNEVSFPAYYSVVLQRIPGDVRVELTATERAAFHSYEFYTWKKEQIEFDGQILIDLAHNVGRKPHEQCTGAEIRVVSPVCIEGFATYQGGWGGENPYKVYFVAEFNTPAHSFGTYKDSVFSNKLSESGKFIGAYVRYRLRQHQKVMVKVGISFSSIQNAKNHLQTIPDWNFEKVRLRGDSIWNSYLSKVRIEGGTPEQRRMFYTGLYRTLIMPTDLTNDNPLWQSDKPHFWDYYAIWDTYRSVMPLHTLLYPRHQQKVIQSLLDIYEHKGWLPDAWAAGDYLFVQGGSNADVVIADAIVKDLGGFDIQKAFSAVRKNAETPSDNPYLYGRQLENYIKNEGYLNANYERCVSRSLEYAYNDYCIGKIAEKLGYVQVARQYYKRAMGIFQLFDAETGFFLAKDSLGNFVMDSHPDIKQEKIYQDAPYFYEGNAWIYATYVPHAYQVLVQKHGGNQKFVNFLDKIFDEEHYEIGNEPGFLTAYLYNYALRPDKTAERVRQLLQKFYLGRSGLPGDDDSGAISSWFSWSAIGLIPVAGQSLYLIGSPLFFKTIIQLENDKTFTIIANNVSHERKYIKSVKLNNKSYQYSWLTHEQILKGGVLEIEMSDIPDSEWGKTVPPPSPLKF
ncbi:MAG: GH92 family glycosyl hydrolase [Cytophagales bacterium]|nr:GH92 family glycosyl hydrolase [Cytophagales bacterium]MDW8384433.1 GH92 family glycosyl hydrolase [Flammeovirgaceae bacterium]